MHFPLPIMGTLPAPSPSPSPSPSFSPSPSPSPSTDIPAVLARNDNGLSAISLDDGTTWLPAKNDAGNSISQIAYGNGLWGMSEADTSDTVYSAIDACTWTANPIGEIGYGIAFGNGVFVWSGDNAGGGNLKTSTDLVTWTPRTAVANVDWSRVAFDTLSGNFAIVRTTSGGTGTFQYSTDDGATWSASNTVANGSWSRIAGGGGCFVATQASTTVLRSLDGGATWAAPGTPPASQNWTGVAYDEIGGRFVIVSSSGTNRAAHSADGGQTWVAATNAPPASAWTSLKVSNGVFIAIGTNICMTSSDGGDTWVSRTIFAGTFDNLGVGYIPELTESADIFDINTAEFLMEGYNLRDLPSTQLGTTPQGILIDSVNKHLYVSGTVSSSWRMNKFSYVSLENIALGIEFISAVNLTPLLTTASAVSAMSIDVTGVDFYYIASNVIYHVVLSTPWDFSTATVESSISVATLASNSNLNYTSLFGNACADSGYLYFGTRVGNTGTNYYIARATLGTGGSVASLSVSESFIPTPSPGHWIVDPAINLTTSQQAAGFTINPATSKIYLAWVNGGQFREYTSMAQTGSFVVSPAILASNLIGQLCFDLDGKYLLLKGNEAIYYSFKTPLP